jgi:glycosyltransferase involved in cell wall biosynthesis
VRALNSVLAQTTDDFEVIVVDDGSTDGSAEAITSFSDSRVRMIKQEHMGVSAARNHGIYEAKTDFIAFLDADDEWDPDHLTALLDLRLRFPRAGIYTTAYKNIFVDGKCGRPRYRYIPPAPWKGLLKDYFKSVAFGDSPVWTSVAGVPVDIFKEVGAFKIGVNRGQDSEMWGRIAFTYPVAFSWSGLGYYYRDAVNSTCRSVPMQEEHPFLLLVRNRYGDESQAPYFIRCYLNKKRLERVNNLLSHGRKKEAFTYFLSKNPFPCSTRLLRKTLLRLLRLR